MKTGDPLKILTFVILTFVATQAQAYDFFSHFSQGSRDAFTGSNKWIWVGGSILTLTALNYDQDIYKHYLHSPQWQPANNVGDIMGTGIPGAAIALITMASGWYSGNKKVVNAGVAHSEALFATFIYTFALKATINRPRSPYYQPPSERSRYNSSFPSGHTSTSFATAGSLMAAAGPWVGVPALMLASMTALSRVQEKAHYLADVIFGATLGYTMGTGFYKHHSQGSKLGWKVLPYFESREQWGVVATYSF